MEKKLIVSMITFVTYVYTDQELLVYNYYIPLID